MEIQSIFQVDAFTEEPFTGNPAGVVMVSDDITTERMQQLAMWIPEEQRVKIW